MSLVCSKVKTAPRSYFTVCEYSIKYFKLCIRCTVSQIYIVNYCLYTLGTDLKKQKTLTLEFDAVFREAVQSLHNWLSILLPFIVRVWGFFTEALIRPYLVRRLKSETARWIYLRVCIRPSLNFVRFFSAWMRWRTNGLSRVWRVLRSHVCITYFRGRVLKRLMVTLLFQRSF